MSDPSPPPKPKPGSLRDRIAAFENKGTSSPQQGPPIPRPKPGNLSQWKPRAPSPPASSDHVQSDDRKPPSTGGMSVSDAMESIGRGGSLKERMAALQGKGALGGPPPPVAPKPSPERPKRKPSSLPVTSDDESKDGAEASGREASRSPPPRAAISPPPENQGTSNRQVDSVAQEGDDGDQEEERQRRATIAARMARLGGTRVGMGPPIFAPKPVVRKSEPALPAPEAEEEAAIDQPSVLKEASQASLTSPPLDSSATPEHAPEPVLDHDESELQQHVPTRAPTSMPVPVGPRRAAPPRKKAPKNAPTAALPEPPVEEAEAVNVHSPPVADDPPATHVDRDATVDSREIADAAEIIEATRNAHSSASVAAVEEHEKQEVEHVAAGAQQVFSEQAHEGVAEEDKEARHKRVAAKLAQMGAFNPLAGPPPVPQRTSLDEPAPARSEEPLDVEDYVHVGTEELGETVPPPPARRSLTQSVDIERNLAELSLEVSQDQGKFDEGVQVPGHRDGEYTVASSEERHNVTHVVTDQGQETATTQQPGSSDVVVALTGSASPETSVQAYKQQEDATADVDVDKETVTSRDEVEPPPLRATRSIPLPPPVNFRSKPTPPSSPIPPTHLPKTLTQALKEEEEERPASPDIPPRPIPPPGRSGSVSEDAPSVPPRRSLPPPPRRTSVRVTDVVTDAPSSPPPVPTASRPRPTTSPIITTLEVQEQAAPAAHDKGECDEDASANVTPQPEGHEDEASVRRRAIAERMARLGGIRFGGPPPMNPLSRPPLPAAPPPTSIPPDDSEPEDKGEQQGEDEDENARKQRIAAKLAGMGGMRLGMLPPSAGLPPTRPVVTRSEDSENEDAVPPVPVPAPQRPPPARKPPPPIEVALEHALEQHANRATSDDGVHVEAEESEMEEIRYSDAEGPLGSEDEGALGRRASQTARAEALPTPPPRMTSRSPPPTRPPIPTIPATLLGRRPSASTSASIGTVSTSSSRHASLDEPGPPPSETPRPHSEYVMVEAEPDTDDAQARSPSPRSHRSRKSTRGAYLVPLPPPPPPSAIDPPEALTSSAQWELPTIPQGHEGEEMASLGSEDSTAVNAASGKALSSFSGSIAGSGSARRSIDQPRQELSTDELMAIWGKVGVRVVDAASALFEKSKRALVGDGSYAGFVRAVLAQVPGVILPPAGEHTDEWGYVVYTQDGPTVHRRVSDILPGDVVVFWDAKLKGHKGLHTYTQSVGAGAPLVGIVSEFDTKKSKVRVWQANQHVGQQTVEVVSYRLEDMKSGQVKVYRVFEA